MTEYIYHPVEDGGEDQDDEKDGERNIGKNPGRIKQEHENECTGNKIILVGNRPLLSPLFSKSPFEITLAYISKKRTGCKECD